MRLDRFAVLMAAVLFASQALAQSSTSDQLKALKDSLSPDEQGSILQSVLGKGDGTGKKTDKKLNTPETVRSKSDQNTDLFGNGVKEKTRDGRILRQSDEDPELRPNDSLLIEFVPIDDACAAYVPGQIGAVGENVPNTVRSNPPLGVGGLGGVGGIDQLNALSAAAGSAAGSALGGPNGAMNPNATIDVRCRTVRKPKTDEEKVLAAKYLKRIASGNPYVLNRFGVLEITGLPAIPLAGLTASEATSRLAADPELIDYKVRISLMRLSAMGDEALKPFGYDLFEGEPSTFAPVSDIQVPVDYVVGPGDTLNIQLYGNEPASYELTVGRDGRIGFPKLGPIMVSGMSFDAVRAAIEQRVTKQLIGSRVSITMGDLRSIRVFVLGEAQTPGSYTVSGLSTMTNALFVSGGVKKIGSLRNIQLKRNGRLVTTLDLYDLLLRGDTSGDRQLLPGDVIFIPPIGNTVAVFGAVRRPAIYELKDEKSAAQAVAIAGGLMPDADLARGHLERISPSRLREMRNIDLTLAAGAATEMANGDKLQIPEIRPTLENSVVLTGHVFRPGSFQYRDGMRLTDILDSFDELRPNADQHYVMIRRVAKPEDRIEVISADLQRALASKGSAADVPLAPRDQIFVFDLSNSRERVIEPVIRDLELQASPEIPDQVVSVDGRVKAPGRYPLEPEMRVSDLIRAGGSLEDAAYRGQAELTRYQIVDGNARQTALIPINLDAIVRGDASADVRLRPYDVLLIKPIPMWTEPGIIELSGEVRFPGKYPIHQGETLQSVLHRAGGFTDVAFPEGAVFIREELKKREKDQIEILASRLQSDLAALSLEAVSSSASVSSSGGGANASQGLVIGQQLLTQLRNSKPIGRLVIDLEQIYSGQPGGRDDVLLRDGDKLVIPKKTQEITILGEVQSPTSHVYEDGLSRDDYIAKSGGTTQKADKHRIYVVRANGDVSSAERSGWFRKTRSTAIHQGDTIVVPLDTERVRALPLWQAVTTIIYNLAIGAILVHNYL